MEVLRRTPPARTGGVAVYLIPNPSEQQDDDKPLSEARLNRNVNTGGALAVKGCGCNFGCAYFNKAADAFNFTRGGVDIDHAAIAAPCYDFAGREGNRGFVL